MARLARLTIPGLPHHVLQQGRGGRPVFEGEVDYRRYLDWLREYPARLGVDIWAYCLMRDHVHLICVPKTEDVMARTFNALHMRYAQYFNRARSSNGSVWRPRFMSCVLDEPCAREEVRFVENNPVRNGLVPRAEDYAWSSARSHVTGAADGILTDGSFLKTEAPDWKTYLAADGDDALIGHVRSRLKTGRPAGDAAFVAKLEGITGRRLEANPRGRPRKVPQPAPPGSTLPGDRS